VVRAAYSALEADGARRLRDESFFSAPQLKRDPLDGGNTYRDEDHVTDRHLRRPAMIALFLTASAVGSSRAQQASPTTVGGPGVEAVWALEEQYWRFVQAGDVDRYRALWDEGFRGWPCWASHPATKAIIGDWVRDIRDQKVRFSYALTREGAADFGDIVVVFYQTPMLYEYPDGRAENRDRVFKFTHTWRKTGTTWKIIGGMCGQLLTPTGP
jgi:ketosteroid isomerase-like protein